MKLYALEMLRWGDVETHHYMVGVYSTYAQAEIAGDVEKTWRAGKYEPRIVAFDLDHIDKEKTDLWRECV